ncbi:MAG: TonB-dependent receptor [Flavobacterium sp.]|nr:TonB-dependent receptor [Flavobacterium sp.]
MTVRNLLVFFAVLCCRMLFAQQDTISLHEVVISDAQLRNFSEMQSVISLSDSILKTNRNDLTSLLKFNTPIYFKENGYGMVSSPSFRGTTAQHTAVIWNGININSQFNGQTDFNTIPTASFEQIDIRSGGGSVIYGSSAIGGTVHLKNELSLSDHFDSDIFVSHGSFNTQLLKAKVSAGTRKWSFVTAVSRISSDNDFELPNGGRNINGQYQSNNVSASTAFRINNRNILKFYSQLTDGERNFSLFLPSDTNQKYFDFNTRNLLEWENRSGKLISKLKVAHLNEQYTYFLNIESDNHSYGKVTSLIGKYDLTYSFNRHQINAVIDYTNSAGEGSDIANQQRSVGAASVLFKNADVSKFGYQIGIRQEFTDNYQSPFLFSAGAKYKIGQSYSIRSNVSRNFRIPTFNDLYWSGGGNENLMPETSYQAEIGNEFSFQQATVSVTAYYSKTENMIQWLPGQTTLWFPQNVKEVTGYGVEAVANVKKSIGKNYFTLAGTYAYTVSENEAGKQLIYVPFHKATGALSYQRSKISANIQMLYNGSVFFRTDNNPRYTVDAYELVNITVGYKISKATIGATVNNIFDKRYFVMDRRPFPGRNFNFYLNLNL